MVRECYDTLKPKINYKKIDKNIRDFVKLLDTYEIIDQTTFSCEDHLNYPVKRPYPMYMNPKIAIRFKTKELRDRFIIKLVETYAFQIWTDGEREVIITRTNATTIPKRREDMINIIPKVLNLISEDGS